MSLIQFGFFCLGSWFFCLVVLVFGVPFWFASVFMARIFSFVFSNSFEVTCAFRHTQRPHPCKKIMHSVLEGNRNLLKVPCAGLLRQARNKQNLPETISCSWT